MTVTETLEQKITRHAALVLLNDSGTYFWLREVAQAAHAEASEYGRRSFIRQGGAIEDAVKKAIEDGELIGLDPGESEYDSVFSMLRDELFTLALAFVDWAEIARQLIDED